MPGGGSAAALAGALGCALASKVAQILLSRPRLSSQARAGLRRDLQELHRFSRKLEFLIRQDARAYQALVKAKKTKRGIALAQRRALEAPLEICEAVAQATRSLKEFSSRPGPLLHSDLKAARALLRGAFEAALAMVEINLRESKKVRIRQETDRRLIRLKRWMNR